MSGRLHNFLFHSHIITEEPWKVGRREEVTLENLHMKYVRVEDCILGEKNAEERLIEDRLFLYTSEKIISSFHWSKPQLQNQVSFYSFASLWLFEPWHPITDLNFTTSFFPFKSNDKLSPWGCTALWGHWQKYSNVHYYKGDSLYLIQDWQQNSINSTQNCLCNDNSQCENIMCGVMTPKG